MKRDIKKDVIAGIMGFVAVVLIMAIFAGLIYKGVTFFDDYFDHSIEHTRVATTDNHLSDKEYAVYDKYEEIYGNLKSVKEKGDIVREYFAKINTETDMSSNSDAQRKETDEEDDYSNTNEQTEGVSEGDVVKTDGKYIYSIDTYSYNDARNSLPVSTMVITKVSGKDMEVSSITEVAVDDGSDVGITDLYLDGDRAVVIGYTSKSYNLVDYNYDSQIRNEPYLGSWGKDTFISVYDISKKEEPVLVSKLTLEGDCVSSRIKDGYLYVSTTVHKNELYVDDCVPKINGIMIEPHSVYFPEKLEDINYTLITSLKIDDGKDFENAIAIAGNYSTLYASKDNIYLTNSQFVEEDITDTDEGQKRLQKYKNETKIYDRQKTDGNIRLKRLISDESKIDADDITVYRKTGAFKSEWVSDIAKIAFDNGEIEFTNHTVVEGNIPDNLSMDEYKGYLRLTLEQERSSFGVETRDYYCTPDGEELVYCYVEGAYSVDGVFDEESNSGISTCVKVLGSDLKEVASIDDIAPGERFYSTRFKGDYGYLVTYMNTDPLFSVDFTDMESPKLVGELEMTGFSDYLHFYRDDLLLGLGEETGDPDSDTVTEPMLKLDMYDLSKGDAKRITSEVVDGFDYSPAQYEYKALMIDTKKNVIGFMAEPIYDDYEYLLEEDAEEEPADESKESYLVYSYDYDNRKFELIKKVPGIDDYNTRGVYIGNYLYVVEPSRGIKATTLDKNDTEVTDFVFWG